jgi:endonuclease/exonuclease/phosphatase family metal-dependent hydrolase
MGAFRRRQFGLAVGAVAAILAAAAPVVSAEPFTVATYTVNWGNVNLRETVEVIRKAEAGLVLLQETNADSEAWLRRHLRGDFPHMLFRGDRGRYPAERLGLLSKSPVTGLKFLPPKHGLFGTWIGRAALGGREVQIVNVHLEPAYFQRGEGLLDAMKVYQRLEDTHGREIRAIHEALAADVPTILAGDLNSLSTFAAPKFLADKGFTDSFASVNENADQQPTWRWPVGRGELSLRLDYLFHTRHFRTLESRIVQSNASDHHLVVSRLEWRKEKDGKKNTSDEEVRRRPGE